MEKYGIELEEQYPEPLRFKTHLGSEYNSLFDLSFVPDECKWISWLKTQAPYEIPIGGTFAKVIVPTIDSIRTNNLLSRLLVNKKHTLLCGSTGTGKSISVIN
jgi:dynein heavy chain